MFHVRVSALFMERVLSFLAVFNRRHTGHSSSPPSLPINFVRTLDAMETWHFRSFGLWLFSPGRQIISNPDSADTHVRMFTSPILPQRARVGIGVWKRR